ncbi:hypothetical protein GCM10025867_49140 (plasmid) [Frondihabitans sucicola]|uniref:DUF2188 domain-containing protein n=1 Tax=Frondihabitans sucicola TaxID=1268041 RepID=A0ABM8GWB2_9MICO|nr:hypothetical protein [Frondihabitans sucicola]BDZ52673.1 hypothetical protein GCM10025867_49140 [Frondihabitans sucicola]
MSLNPTERVVHAALSDGGEIVRYDKAGAWYVEWPPGGGKKRRKLKLSEAVALAVEAHDSKGGFVALGRYGGTRFDADVRKALRSAA